MIKIHVFQFPCDRIVLQAKGILDIHSCHRKDALV